MEFRKKIDKILSIKKIKLWRLGVESGLNNTLEKAYDDNREMRAKQTEKFLQNLRINSVWWKTGQGAVFIDQDEKPSPAEIPAPTGTKTMDMDVWEVIKGSNKIHEASHKIFELEFERLWGLIEKFGPSAPINKEPIQKNGN